MEAVRIFVLMFLGLFFESVLLASARTDMLVAQQVCHERDSVEIENKKPRAKDGNKIAEVEVVAPRLREVVSSGKPLQVLDRNELEILGLDNLADAIAKFAGAEVKDYGGLGGMKTVSVRNLGAYHTAVSYDGTTIGNTQAGQIDIGRYAIDNVQTLSIAVGDNDDMMQTARNRASASVLYIETMKPTFAEGHEWNLRTKLRTGAFGLLNPSLSYGQKLGGHTRLGMFAEFMRADGNYSYILENGGEHTKEKRHNSDINAWRGEANLYHDLAHGEMMLKVYGYHSERGLPGSVVLYNPVNHERLWDEDVFLHGSIKLQLDRQWRLNVHAKYTHTWNKYRDVDVKYQDGEQVEVNRQNESYLSSTVGWQPSNALSVSLAQDWIYGNLHSNGENPAQPKRWTSLTALNGKWKWNGLELSAGCVATWVTEDVEHGNMPDDRKRLSPTIALSVRPFANEAFYIRTMMKHTFRVPTFNDLYYNRIGTTTLRPENAKEYNVGLAWQGVLLRGMKYLSASVDAYYNDVDDKIVAFPTLYVWKMANYGRVKMYGINATLSCESRLAKGIDMTMLASYALQISRDYTDKSTSYYKQQLPYTPRHVGHGTIAVSTPWFRLAYNLSACGERYCLQDHKPSYRLKPYWEHGLTISRAWKLYRSNLTTSATIDNLTNEQYEVVKFYPMPRRSWTMSVVWEL